MKLRQTLSLFTLTMALVLAACSDPEQASAPRSAAEPVTEAQVESADAAGEAEAPATDSTALASVEESMNGIDDTASDDSIELSDEAPAAPQQTAWKYREGAHFRRLTSSQGTSSSPDKIEVAEIFWYGCPHCYDFDPVIENWKAQLPADVSFVRIPVIWNPTNQIHARLMYTAEALGILDKAHPAAFAEIHQKGNMLTEDDAIIAFFASLGVSEEDFREAYGSFGVTSAVKRAENLTRRYGIRSVPIIVVNGKYVTEGPEIRNFDDLLNITNELIERERRER